jgi:uncharacterized membrane protein
MADLEKQLQRWVDARLIDAAAAGRIRQFEEESGKGRLRWPAVLAIGFGALMLCAGILLFVASHWDDFSPGQRFSLVLGMVALFHLAAGFLGTKVPAIGVALHSAGTVALGAGIFLAGQIFNLEEHWPGGVMLWALGAVLAWLVLRQWPQALMAAVLIPAWIGGEWSVATENYSGAPWNIAAQGFLLLAILYFSVTPSERNRPLRAGMVWVGALALLPFIIDVIGSAESTRWTGSGSGPRLPAGFEVVGYGAAYLPALALAAFTRKKRSIPMFVAAFWVLALSLISRGENPEHNAWIYLWVGLGACALGFWGVREGRRLFINYGTALFALDVITFYFSDVLDKLGRSMGLILMGAIFLAGGWVLNRLRTDLIARAAAARGGEK